MKLTPLLESVIKRRFWEDVEKTLLEEAAVPSDLKQLLDQANELVFNKFGINQQEQTYFIAGSARLYLYPSLKEAFNLKTIGDLDIVIPDTAVWDKAEILGPRYAPNKSIEVFTTWQPEKAIKSDEPDKVVDKSVDDSETILSRAKLVDGYWFMAMEDVMDYKLLLNRDKEKAITKLLITYVTLKEPAKKQEIVNQVMALFGGNKEAFKSFLNRGAITKAQQYNK